jgi:two-component system, OmpR family, response regulator MtrA
MGGPQRQSTIAVIDDDTMLGDIVAELLREEGYLTVHCAHATEAHACVVEQQPDLVLLDLVFGREERGWDILDAHVVDPKTNAIPVILITAISPSAIARRDRLEQLGVPLLPKPFHIEELLACIARALGGRPRLRRVG